MAGKLEVVIAGGGVAGLEAAFALRALAGERVSVTVVSGKAEFVYRPLAVREPFTDAPPERHGLAALVAEAGAGLVGEAFRWVDAAGREVHTRGGRRLPYDVFLLALGARARSAFRHARALDLARLPAQLATLLEEVRTGELRRVAAVVPSRAGWPLPLYELCLHLATAAREHGRPLELTLATPEEAPLQWFGDEASEAVAELLAAAGVRLLTGVGCEIPEPGRVSVRPGTVELAVDRVLALPAYYGPSTPGVPKSARGGFITVDPLGRVRGLLGVYAAGDATDFPVKSGAVAGQQADTAAQAIAAAAGAKVTPEPFAPHIQGALLGGARPLYMSAHLLGEYAYRAELADTPVWPQPTRIAAPYLAAHLDRRQTRAGTAASG
jgi:sulfide:quinone oxidoreductase